MSPLRVVIGLAIASAILFCLHYYLWARLIRDTGLPMPWRLVATVAMVTLGSAMLGGFALMRSAPRGLSSPVLWVGYSWMGLASYLLVLFAAADLFKLAYERVASIGTDPSRRQYLARLISAVAGFSGVGLSLWAAQGARAGAVIVKRVKVRLTRLSPSLAGYRIVQITDLHVGPTIGRAFVQEVVERANALGPQLIAITGDLIDGSLDQLGELVAPLKELRARDGVYFVTGNHEYYSPGLESWLAYLRQLGVRVLRNERVRIGGPDGFDLAGIDDRTAKSYGRGHGADLPRALAGRGPERAVILLAHQPRQVKDAVQFGVDLQLSGHTHGGQFFPFSLLVRLFEPYLAGLFQVGPTQLYVSRGTGYWGPPMRLGSPAEITEFELS